MSGQSDELVEVELDVLPPVASVSAVGLSRIAGASCKRRRKRKRWTWIITTYYEYRLKLCTGIVCVCAICFINLQFKGNYRTLELKSHICFILWLFIKRGRKLAVCF